MPGGPPLGDPPLTGGDRPRRPGPGTRAVHPTRPAPQDGVPIAPVIDPSSTYAFDDVDAFAKASEEKTGAGYVYTRWANPTVDAFASAVGDLEEAAASDAMSSGMAAISSVYLALCSAGDRVVTARQLYGGTHSLFTDLLPRYGIEADFFDVGDFAGIEGALTGAKALHCETIGNPRVRVADIASLAELARAADVPLVVDNTFASPVLCRPLTLGASIVVHSATKAIGGHHDLIGGVICADDPALLARIQELTRETGPTMSPFTAWLALRGLATIHLRVSRACDSALEVARFLEAHPKVDTTSFPALDSSPDRALCDRMLGGRGGSVIGFDVAGGRAQASEFQARLRLISRAASLGGTHSLIVHAASVTHTQLTGEQLREAGISEGFCRLSIGLEDPEDLIADLDQALA